MVRTFVESEGITSVFHLQHFVMLSRLNLNKGLHLDFGALQWSKLIEIRKAQHETKNNPSLTSVPGLRAAAAPRKRPQSTELRHAPFWDCLGAVGLRQTKARITGSVERLTRCISMISGVASQQRKQSSQNRKTKRKDAFACPSLAVYAMAAPPRDGRLSLTRP